MNTSSGTGISCSFTWTMGGGRTGVVSAAGAKKRSSVPGRGDAVSSNTVSHELDVANGSPPTLAAST
jgi:hypothetical protein